MLNVRKLDKENPEKVKAFLKDVVEDTALPEAARTAALRLLVRYTKTGNLRSAIKGENKEMIKELKEQNQGQ